MSTERRAGEDHLAIVQRERPQVRRAGTEAHGHPLDALHGGAEQSSSDRSWRARLRTSGHAQFTRGAGRRAGHSAQVAPAECSSYGRKPA